MGEAVCVQFFERVGNQKCGSTPCKLWLYIWKTPTPNICFRFKLQLVFKFVLISRFVHIGTTLHSVVKSMHYTCILRIGDQLLFYDGLKSSPHTETLENIDMEMFKPQHCLFLLL